MSFTLNCIKTGSEYRLLIAPQHVQTEPSCYISKSPCEMMDNNRLAEFIQEFNHIEVDKDNVLRLSDSRSPKHHDVIRVLEFSFLGGISIDKFPYVGSVKYDHEAKLHEKEIPQEPLKEGTLIEEDEILQKESSQERCTSQVEQDMWGRLARIQEREESLSNSEKIIGEREINVSEREDSIKGREIAVAELQSTLDERTKYLDQIEEKLVQSKKEFEENKYRDEELTRISQYIIDSNNKTQDMEMIKHMVSIIQNKVELLDLFVNDVKFDNAFAILMLVRFYESKESDFTELIKKYNCASKLFDLMELFRSYASTNDADATASGKCRNLLWKLMTDEQKESKQDFIRNIVANYALKLSREGTGGDLSLTLKKISYWTSFMTKNDL